MATYCHAMCGCPVHFPNGPKARLLRLVEAVSEWREQANDCNLGPDCNCVGHDDLHYFRIDEALAAVRASDEKAAPS